MGILRFPNPGSDLPRFISTFAAIYKELQGEENFTHDQTRDAVVRHGMVSSSGAIGLAAVERSFRKDRTRDPMYNQLKMYSELYRMLGWLRPGTQNTNFQFTELSFYVAESAPALQNRIFEECLLSITFPNPLVESLSGNRIRPFSFVLQLSALLDDVIFRDELIVAVYPLKSDRAPSILEQTAASIKKLRENNELLSAKKALSDKIQIQENTLENYTRFPLGSIKGLGWYNDRYVKGIYEMPVKGYVMQEAGKEKVNQLNRLVDVRYEDIIGFSEEERAAFTLLAHYIFLERCGLDLEGVVDMMNTLTVQLRPMLDKLGIQIPQEIFYSPTQQSEQYDIKKANELEASFDL